MQMALAYIRSALYTFVFFFWAALASIACYLAAVTQGNGPLLARLGVIWQQGNAVLEKYILGLTYKIEGMENMPQGPCIVAMQHQSAWETMKLIMWFDKPAIVLKAELLDLPVWGKAMRIYGSIPVARSRKMEDLKKMLKAAQAARAAGRPIVIFPHGTRMKLGVKRPLQGGVGVLYENLQVPMVPVSLNSGEFWGKKAFLRLPGVVRVVFHPPIPPGLPREEVMEKLDALINVPLAPYA